jgi:hypothetical protein
MIMNIKLFLFAILILVCFQLVIAFSGSGQGTVDDPYNITTCEQLNETRNNLTAHYILGQDINCAETVGWNVDNCADFNEKTECEDSGCSWKSIEVGYCENITPRFIDLTPDFCHLSKEVCSFCRSYVDFMGQSIWHESYGLCGSEGWPWLSEGQTCNDSRDLCWLNCNGDWVYESSIDGCEASDKIQGFDPIGTIYPYAPFTGVFDGNGKKITNLFIYRYDDIDVGLFGYIGQPGEVKNLVLENENVVGFYKVGGLVGECGFNCKILNSSTGGSVMAFSGRSIGGLVGINSGYINESFSTATVDVPDAYGSTGGLVGDNAVNGRITNCYARGDVNGAWGTGGLTGWNDGIIKNCYATGNVTGTSRVGGLVGHDLVNPEYGGSEFDNSNGKIIDSYATGTVTGTSNVGGIIGFTTGKIINCSWNNRSNDNADYCYNEKQRCSCPSGPPFLCLFPCNYPPNSTCCASKGGVYHAGGPGNNNCTAVSDDESFFFHNQSEPMDVWNFNNVWDICEGMSYPWLRWQDLDMCPFYLPPGGSCPPCETLDEVSGICYPSVQCSDRVSCASLGEEGNCNETCECEIEVQSLCDNVICDACEECEESTGNCILASGNDCSETYPCGTGYDCLDCACSPTGPPHTDVPEFNAASVIAIVAIIIIAGMILFRRKLFF